MDDHPSGVGKFKPAEAHYRCGLAYSYWAQSSQGGAAEALFRQAQDHLWEAVTAEPYHWAAYFNLAYVQVNLEMYQLARQNNEKAIEIRPGYAPAKYNLTICWIKLGNLDAALKELKSIEPEDESAERVIKTGSEDGDLKPLLRDGECGPEARRFLEAFNNQSS
ncbi:MAG: tetratricopeptide repeat protein [bacterium]|nr:tetratricopeptide repeat protein [bacterium]